MSFPNGNNTRRQPAAGDDSDGQGDVVQVDLPKVKPCPHQDIIALYHEILPELPRVREWRPGGTAYKALKTRWREKAERRDLAWWRSFFGDIRQSHFLMGKATDFQADLTWIVKAGNFEKIMNGRYKRAPVSSAMRRTINNIEAGRQWLAAHGDNDQEEEHFSVPF